MASFFGRLFPRGSRRRKKEDAESFAARFHRFRLFLNAHIDAYGEMLAFEERLAGEMPFGMPFLRVCTTRLTIAAMQCVLQLNALGGGRFEPLSERFSRLRGDVREILDQGLTPLSGPLLVPYAQLGDEHAPLISKSLTGLEAVRTSLPECMPRGFTVTGAAWWQYFSNPSLHDEIDRIMLISQDDPASYSEAAAAILERMRASFPLQAELVTEVREMLRGFAELERPGHVLIVRCLPVLPEHAALVIPEQVLNTPLHAEGVLAAVLSSFAMTYRPRAVIYRLKRGIRDRAMPLCLSLTLLPVVHGRGSAHRAQGSPDPETLILHVRRGFAAPEGSPLQASAAGASLPGRILASVREKARQSLACLADAPAPGKRHEIIWAVSADGRFSVTGVNSLADALREDGALSPPGEGETALSPQSPKGQRRAQFSFENSMTGGFSASPGTVCGPVFPVRNFADALAFPIGSILLLQQAAPRWSFLLDFAAGAVVGDGSGNGFFARTARRYGRPTILRMPDFFDRLPAGARIRLNATADGPPHIRPEPEEGKPAGRSAPYSGRSGHTPPLWLPASDLAEMARKLAPKVVSLSLPDTENIDFLAENCKSFHDIIVYCHEHAVREMFRAGESRASAQAPAKQLLSDVPTQFWIINLDDGFYGESKDPFVRLEQIASIPLRALWEGFTAKTWEGPPQLNARGFLSVLFEASANPGLDPAAQSSRYTEKNVFLIARRFCSMRCRFGFHFLSLDCLLGERERERFIIFQFKGGAANLARRIRRVHFVAQLLARFDFATEIRDDTLAARMEERDEKTFLGALRILGYLTMHTRQLDMIMGDENALTSRRFAMLEDMLALAARQPLPLP